MPRKKSATKTTKRTTKTARKTTSARTGKVAEIRVQSSKTGFFEYLKLGESYTSLVLGIIAVIIGTMLILSVFHNTQTGRETPEVSPTIAQSEKLGISPSGKAFKQPDMTKTPSPAVSAKPAPKAQPKQAQKPMVGKTYTVAAGDNLWIIAEKTYGSGYNWVDIAKANNLSHPGDIEVGQKLSLPQAKQVVKDIPTVHTADDNMSTSYQPKIVVETYKVVPGDNLWGIALRAYGDGYQWVKIAKANNLTNPNVIHKDNVLKIPRG